MIDKSIHPKSLGQGANKVTVGDIQVHIIRTGQGEPVVFIHGLAEDHSSWDPVIQHLMLGYSYYTLDLRGHGGTTSGRGEGTAQQLAGDLIGFLESCTGPAICVGFSLGGVVVLEAALARPDLVKKVIAIGTSSKVGRAAAEYFGQRIHQIQTDMPAFREALRLDTAAQVVRNMAAVDDISQVRVKAVGDGAGYINAARAMVALAGSPMTERLRAIRVPVHIIQGVDDMFCPKKAADILREAMPHATYAEIEQAGHLIAADQPEQLAREISRALTR